MQTPHGTSHPQGVIQKQLCVRQKWLNVSYVCVLVPSPLCLRCQAALRKRRAVFKLTITSVTFQTLSHEVVLHWRECAEKRKEEGLSEGVAVADVAKVKVILAHWRGVWWGVTTTLCFPQKSQFTGQGQIQGDRVPAERRTWARQSAAGSVSHVEVRTCFPKLFQWAVRNVCVGRWSCNFQFGNHLRHLEASKKKKKNRML